MHLGTWNVTAVFQFPFKLKAHGIGNGMINWIEKWLIDRRQRVVVDGEFSN